MWEGNPYAVPLRFKTPHGSILGAKCQQEIVFVAVNIYIVRPKGGQWANRLGVDVFETGRNR